MTDQRQRWLAQQLRYTEAMNKRDKEGAERLAAEKTITTQLFKCFLEYGFVEHARSVYACILEHFPRVPEEPAHVTPKRAKVVAELLTCIYCWHDHVADNVHPSEAEATEVSQQLVLLGLSLLSPHLVEVVPQTAEETKPPTKGTLFRYSATPMLVTLMIRTEDGQEVTLALDDDVILSIAGHHEGVSYKHFDDATQKLLDTQADKITCDIKDGHITRMVIEKDGLETEE